MDKTIQMTSGIRKKREGNKMNRGKVIKWPWMTSYLSRRECS